MKRFLLVLAILSVCFCSCENGNEVLDGSVLIQWKKNSYSTKQLEGKYYYVVSQYGETFSFMCDNVVLGANAKCTLYSRDSLADTWQSDNEALSVEIKNNTVTVTVRTNTPSTHYYCLNIADLNQYGSIYFVQDPSL